MKLCMFIELQMPNPRHADSEYECFWQAIEQMTCAEEMGLERVWLVEHHFRYR